jgi:hypothetical protein
MVGYLDTRILPDLNTSEKSTEQQSEVYVLNGRHWYVQPLTKKKTRYISTSLHCAFTGYSVSDGVKQDNYR